MVAVELPATLEEVYLEAIRRLPQISVIFYNDPVSRSQRSDRDDETEQAVYVPVEPADPFVEAIRSAQEIGAQVVFADPDSNERPHLPDTYPDSYALTSIPLTPVCRSVSRLSAGAHRRKWSASPAASRGSCRAPIRSRACWWCFR